MKKTRLDFKDHSRHISEIIPLVLNAGNKTNTKDSGNAASPFHFAGEMTEANREK